MQGKPAVERLVEEARGARGRDYFIAMSALKLYIQKLTIREFEEEMKRVYNPQIFVKLWAIGLTFEQQELATQRWKELGR